MSKIDLDSPRTTTVHTPFGESNYGRKPLFAVRDGVDLEDALAHLSMALRSAFETNMQVCEQVDRSIGVLAWATHQSLEVSQALIEALLGGLANRNGDG